MSSSQQTYSAFSRYFHIEANNKIAWFNVNTKMRGRKIIKKRSTNTITVRCIFQNYEHNFTRNNVNN